MLIKKNLFVDGDDRQIAIARSRTQYKRQLSFQLSSNNKDVNNQDAIFTFCFVPLKNAEYMFNEAVRTKGFTIMIQSPSIKKQESESRPAKLNSEARNNAENALKYEAQQYQQKSNGMKGRIQYLMNQIKQMENLFQQVQAEVPENNNDNFNLNIRNYTRPPVEVKRLHF